MPNQTQRPRNQRQATRQGQGARSRPELPLVAFALACGHLKRDYGVMVGDWLWCGDCSDQIRVVRLIT